jgi:SNF2 family DNA or RNA helicase
MMMMKSRSSASLVNHDDYDSDLALLDTASESESITQGNVSDNQLTVDKILGRKFLLNQDGESEELFFIKWKGMSYLHASWERRDDIEKVDLSAKQKLKRFLQMPQAPGILGLPKTTSSADTEEVDLTTAEEDEVEYFNPDMVEAQRIISCDTISTSHAKARTPEDLITFKNRKRKQGSSDSFSEDESEEESTVRYLVKWRGLSYDECTWERWGDIKSWYQEVWLFWYLQRPPRNLKAAITSPPIQEYKKLALSPIFGESKLIESAEEGGVPVDGLQLRDYQLEGVNWLMWNWWHKRPCVLADEMGLGKYLPAFVVVLA